ncbi:MULTISPECIES: MBL fold metallo-hydrolase [unclassified Mesorhizobium]|uniref:MBL fold metallo-hydrolase n=1 Tax=unclassified Mesorhizobium TaxID=325217 RepID=UPI000FCA813F|nr:MULTISPECIES: MBL fold metallo-hydrolase [unclassified Mesorhizobium]RUZ83146.1 MBL fold metallo-hydrolase [Mesorhizobium sp. M7A.F.Ca.US.003.02.2.1]RUY95337.1 MBL fold metallo-hydrolase [Mesorhizobium sp. M7A.F.Ca.CA.001.12.2.1]RUZ27133.1 MBL fold metallo-hydrolase [Mesorhizobium sp. M7A.F.Ca.US.007.01.2.1]RUZ44886.1 MBL fold metallo-hydrolase [Mesorhizobium sp. M7A.F.Ca.US.003.02.1.1]RUZ70201.1 MBL fold metallo-hydrolase [Mesorhizobium sp. M7A.F.Ca.US.007.01.1.1]
MALKFDTGFDPLYGQGVSVAPDVQRITARNPSPFTFHGTNSYIVGRDTLAVIDPGPDDEAHLRTLLEVIAGRPVSHIFVSHTHRDHSPLAARLKERAGAIVLAEGPHRPARALHIGETNALDASADMAFVPDIALSDGEAVDGDGWSIRTVLTPGHTANHAAFALEGTGILFSADHVMAWATSIVAPPDGAMADYMASLDRLIDREDRLLLPGHGGPVTAPRAFMRGLKTHRKMRERAILERVREGDRTIPDMVRAIYRDTDPRLHGAAGLSVLAHLEDLTARGLVVTDSAPAIDGIFTPAG